MTDSENAHASEPRVDTKLDDDPDRSGKPTLPRIDKVEYFCPEYIQSQSVHFQSLPAEILINVVRCLDPSLDIRALRYVKKVFKGTNVDYLGDVAEQLLVEQRDMLLHHSTSCTCKVDGHYHEFGDFVGKQYVCEREDIEGDEWAFKKSQLPPANGYYFSSSGPTDDMFYKWDRLNIDLDMVRDRTEDEFASRLYGVEPIPVYRNGQLVEMKPGLKGYGGVFRWATWG